MTSLASHFPLPPRSFPRHFKHIQDIPSHPSMTFQTWDAFQKTLLSGNDMAERFAQNLRLRHPGTCNWFLQGETYCQWKNEKNKTLFCIGPPGVGKSVLAAAVIDELKGPERLVLFLFCDNDIQRVDQLIRHLIQQILAHIDYRNDMALLARLSSTMEGNNTTDDRDMKALEMLLCYSRTKSGTDESKVSLVLDGLDRLDLEISQNLLSKMSGLRDKIALNIFATSTLTASVTTADTSLTFLASDTDLTQFVTARVQPPGSLSSLEHAEFYRNIVKEAKGIFGIADGIVELVSPMRIKYDFQQFLKGWTRDPGYLDRIFGRLIETRQKRLQAGLAPHAIDWLTFSARELTIPELQHALIADNSEHFSGPPEPAEIILALCGFVLVDGEPGQQSICFYHSALKQYFLHERRNRALKIHDTIVSYCLTQLTRVYSSDGFCHSDEEYEERLERNPFFLYAACHWSHHTEECTEPIAAARSFLDSYFKVTMSSQAIFIRDAPFKEPGYSQKVPRDVTGLHLAAYFGIQGAAEKMLSEGPAPLSSVDTEGRTPLWWAAFFKQYKIVRLFCRSDTTTLSRLVMAKNKKLVQVLVKGKYAVNIEDASKDTPLHQAVRHGLVEITGDLLSAGADVNVENMGGETPLSIALNNREPKIVRLLVEKGAYTDFVDTLKFRKALAWHNEVILEISRENKNTMLQLQPRETNPFAASADTRRVSLQQEILCMNPLPSWLESVIGNHDIGEFDLQISPPSLDDHIEENHRVYYVTAFMWNSANNSDNPSNGNGRHPHKNLAHFTNMPHIWLPDNGAVFLKHFLGHVKATWLAYCEANLVDLKLRKRIIESKGTNPALLNLLMTNGQRWLSHRHELSKVILKIQKFATYYCLQHNETRELKGLTEAINQLSITVGEKLGELDKNSRDLIQLECNLVSIKEARDSFTFLPLTFVGTLFGMNVDILDGKKPAWWTYVPFAAVISLLTSVVWLLFKFTEVSRIMISTSVSRKGTRDDEQGLDE
ncbi:hypothetical protein CCUS01_11358 [Colletotrichum cuscutae]|uniref:Nephrocystin 3-like N-terminal domain-containing protein n=1 Tax=Colletotrichum cuscutae TaxID=1209917 RepID=A0AAI9U629_9PEZI|nr:hypothetical protein CCUS01_11358 [Colletotrichum cuscutae]